MGPILPPDFFFQLLKAAIDFLKDLPLVFKLLILTPLVFELLEFLVDVYLEHRERQYLRSVGFEDLDKLTGIKFEKFLEILFKDLGYKVRRTQASRDFGADLIIEKDGKRTVVQAKRYKGSVGIKAVQEIVAARNYYDADDCMVVTNSKFTGAAVELSRKNGVKLVGKSKLKKMIRDAGRSAQKRDVGERSAQPEHTHRSSPSTGNSQPAQTATCCDCGRPVSEKVMKYCLEHRKEFLGNIYCFDCQQKIRAAFRETQQLLRKSDNPA